LRQEVETLLHSSGKTLGFLQQPVAQAVQQIAAEEIAGKGLSGRPRRRPLPKRSRHQDRTERARTKPGEVAALPRRAPDSSKPRPS
jgi:hypothetical protein